MATPRQLLEDYVTAGKLMQLATVNADGAPIMCTVWYQAGFGPDRLRWISSRDRAHSRAVRADPRVAGAIVAIEIEGLGQTVRGVSFTGHGRELAATGVNEQIAAFISRWPAAAPALDSARLARPETLTRLYEVEVSGWVLFDEEHFPGQPRQEIPAR